MPLFAGATLTIMGTDSILALIPLAPAVAGLLHSLCNLKFVEEEAQQMLWRLAQLGALCFIVSLTLTILLIPRIKVYTLRAGLFGKDLGKQGTTLADVKVPESLGLVSGVVYLVILIFALVPMSQYLPERVLDLNSALISISIMLFLGFTDDVLDWPWRYKLLLPTIATLPLLTAYSGSTSIVVPTFMRAWLMEGESLTLLGEFVTKFPSVVVDTNAGGAIVNLGLFYLLYMSFLSVFTTNAINIYAGINGLEAGQSYIIGCFVLLHNLIEISNNSLSKEHHFFSAILIIPFLGGERAKRGVCVCGRRAKLT